MTKNHILSVAKKIAKDTLKEGAQAFVEANPEFMPPMPLANVAIDKAIGSGMEKKPRKKRV